MLPVIEQILLQIVSAIGAEACIRCIFSGSSLEQRRAILDAEYAAMEAALDVQQAAAAKEP